MKQKDILLIVVVAIVAAVSSYIIATQVFVRQDRRQQKVEVVDEIKPTMESVDKRFFNVDSINPARDSSLGSTNPVPFNGTSQ